MSKFDMIGKASKKKDTTKQTSNFFKIKLLGTKNNRSQVNLNSHETHMQTQIHAGIDILGRPLNPMELTQLKEQRTSELRAAQEHHKHAALFSGMSRVSFISLIIRGFHREVELFRQLYHIRHIANRLNLFTVLPHLF